MKKIIFLLLLCLALGSCEDKPAPKADGESTTMTEAEKGEEFEKTEEAEEAEEVEEVEEVVWEARTIVFDNCDTAKGWQGGPKTDTAEYVEGEGSVAFTVKKNGDQFVVSKAFSDPIDVSDMTAVEFDLYLSNPELMEKHRYLSLEISSSGVCDVEELSWSDAQLRYQSTLAGWNHVVLFFSEGGTTGGAIDLSRVNFFRMYMLEIHGLEEDITVRFDNIVFTNRQNETSAKPIAPAPELASTVPASLGANETNNGTATAFPSEKSPVLDGGGIGASLAELKHGSRAYVVADANVRQFGAAGDGQSDDTEAFKAAIRYVNGIGGGTVFVPEGAYVITSYLDIPGGVCVMGDLEEGTANGTVLYAYFGKDRPSGAGFLRLDQGAALQSVAIWYPEQVFTDGKPIMYSYTIQQTGGNGITLENITLVNSYNGIDMYSLDNDSLQTVRRIYGTILKNGMMLDTSYDIGRYEGINFSPRYWLDSGLPNTPGENTLRNYMLQNAVGMTVGRIDWTYYADINIEGCYAGIKFAKSDKNLAASDLSGANGHIYKARLKDCFYGIYADYINDIALIATDIEITTKGGEGSIAVYCTEKFVSDIAFNSCSIESEGKYALYNAGSGIITIFDSSIKSADTMYMPEGRYSLVNVEANMPNLLGYELLSGDTPKAQNNPFPLPAERRPQSSAFVDMSAEPYDIKSVEGDISSLLQSAIDSLSETGGIVYLPAGRYYLENPITLHAGIELRGSADYPHFTTDISATLMTDYGQGDPEGTALFTLHDGAGLRGLNVVYYNQNMMDVVPYAFTIRGAGKDIYICNMMMNSSYNMVDLASYQCDGHYIEYIWGAPLYRGIVVGGGSKNGTIRDCHFTPNCVMPDFAYPDHYSANYAYVMKYSEPFVIGESEGEIVYHNFVYGAYRGLTLLDGAKEAYVLGHGVDSGVYSVYAEGDCNALLVNSQLVNYLNVPVLNLSSKVATPEINEFNYILTDKSFAGKLTFINCNMWGMPTNSIVANGTGTLELVQGAVLNPGSRFIVANAGETYAAGIHVKNQLFCDVLASGDAKVRLLGNIFASGGKFIAEDFAEITK